MDEFAVLRKFLNQRYLTAKEEAVLGWQKDLRTDKAEKLIKKTKSREIRVRANKVKEKTERLKKEAKKKLIERNLRLVLSMANKKAKENRTIIPDLFQDGCIGLLKAVEKFDHRLGNKFSTYAVWWIRQAMQRGKSNSNAVQVTNYVREAINRYLSIHADFLEKFERPPTIDELARKMTVSKEIVVFISSFGWKGLSLDHPVIDNPDWDPLIGVISGDVCIEDEIHRRITAKEVSEIISQNNSPIKVRIIKERFGIGRTLTDIGEDMGLSRERIRQLQNEALKKTRENIKRGY